MGAANDGPLASCSFLASSATSVAVTTKRGTHRDRRRASSPADRDPRFGEPGGDETQGHPNARLPSVTGAEIELLRRADAALTFVRDWSEQFGGTSLSDPANPLGYAALGLDRLYDEEGFTYVRHAGDRAATRRWPLNESVPELRAVIGVRAHFPQFVGYELPKEGALTVRFLERKQIDRRKLPSSASDSQQDRLGKERRLTFSTEGDKQLTLGTSDSGWVILKEEQSAHTPLAPGYGQPRPPMLDFQVPSAAQLLVIAERLCPPSKRDRCEFGGTFVLIRSAAGHRLLHLTEAHGKNHPAVFVEDAGRYVLKSREHGFSFARSGRQLQIDMGWREDGVSWIGQWAASRSHRSRYRRARCALVLATASNAASPGCVRTSHALHASHPRSVRLVDDAGDMNAPGGGARSRREKKSRPKWQGKQQRRKPSARSPAMN